MFLIYRYEKTCAKIKEEANLDEKETMELEE